MADLLKIQAEQRKDLAAGVHLAWLSQKEFEKDLLEPYHNNYIQAPDNIKEEINKGRDAFLGEWGSDGKLAALMDARHTEERTKLSMRLNLAQSLDKGRSNDREHDR